MQVVWLKRDLRIRDHRPIVEAASRPESCVVLYIYEPEVFSAPDFDACHLDFINASLKELDSQLRQRGGFVTFRLGEAAEVLEQFRRAGMTHLWSHEETGNAITYARDKRVKRWAQQSGVVWTEIPQFGVFRPLHDRDGWAKRWDQRMSEKVVAPPDQLRAAPVLAEGIRSSAELGLEPSSKVEAQVGGESHAWQMLESFVAERGINYRSDMSSPVEGWEGCSRLSPHLAYGTIAMREVWQTTRAAVAELRQMPKGDVDKRWFQSLSSFEGRLHWHCHFIQKLEDQPQLEFENMSRMYDGMREPYFDEALFDAWREGQTGYPMVDACMRCLKATGWLNFRMRAMVVSFASYHLWLDWRRTAPFLARQFVDYEPGIHYPQFQMQSGVTGINTVRIYSPSKQVTDQDPTGVFIRRWVPELEAVADADLPNPEKMPSMLQHQVGCVIGRDYPAPVVDHQTVYKGAKDRIWQVRKQAAAREEAAQVYERHGSRKRPAARNKQ